MIINSAPDNIAVLGNVSEIGEFRIKNSAKAFAILSSGLYANKIRAIIRELSCNALDSHIAAGKKEEPFDLHLPTSLEPYFAIRDYGTGLTHQQVINIYTTYFESTKTNSNDFIGALGLGSKSPFSYTDNFTVTAIHDGIKGIYSAFINEHGVPSVARMADAETDEANGVEVKFAVDIRSDYDKFRNEAAEVLAYFPVKPNMTGAQCKIRELKYLEVDVIQGVNVIDFTHNHYDHNSIAVMGNIPYPIDVPNSESNLGQLAVHLKKGIEIRFNIGELEFQASREGLSYTKETIAAIKAKLQLLQDKLDGLLEKEANAIPNLWDRAEFLRSKFSIALWHNSIKNYVRKTSALSFMDVTSYGIQFINKTFTEEYLASKYNIKISGFTPDTFGDRVSQLKLHKEYDNKKHCYVDVWSIPTGKNVYFVKYGKVRGGLEHAKYHFNKNVDKKSSHIKVYILSPVKSDEPVLYDAFLKEMYNPPESFIINGDDMEVKPREERTKRDAIVTALRLSSSHHYQNKSYIWEPYDNINLLEKTKTYYYIPLKGYAPICDEKYPIVDVKDLLSDISKSGISELTSVTTIYGIRKADLEYVKSMKNWVNIQDHLVNTIKNVNVDSLVGSYARKTLNSNVFNICDKICNHITDPNSLYLTFIKKCKNSHNQMDTHAMRRICNTYGNNITVDTFVDKILKEINEFTKKYPLLQSIDYKAKEQDVAMYINLIDQTTKQTINT